MQSMQVVVEAMVSRLHADFSDGDLNLCMEMFDVPTWQKVLRLVGSEDENAAQQGRDLEQRMKKCCKRLCSSLKLNFNEVWPQLRDVLAVLLVQELQRQGDSSGTNSEIWALALQDEWWLKQGASLTGHHGHDGSSSWKLCDGVRNLIRFYLSLADGTGKLERQLGKLTDMLRKHEGPLNEDGATVAALMQLHFDGPQAESGLFTHPAAPATAPQPGAGQGGGRGPIGSTGRSRFNRAPGGSSVSTKVACRRGGCPSTTRRLRGCKQVPQHAAARQEWQFTPFSRECAKLWIEWHGRRFHRKYMGEGKGGKKRPPTGGHAPTIMRS